MLAVEIFFVAIANRQNFLRVADKLTALVDLQLHTEKLLSCSIEMQFGAIIVIVDDLILQDMIAAFTVGIIAIVQIARLVV